MYHVIYMNDDCCRYSALLGHLFCHFVGGLAIWVGEMLFIKMGNSKALRS